MVWSKADADSIVVRWRCVDFAT
eukprot:SAG11_NODE_35168_length_268_cov_0.603550_1_plen_22_part_10